MLINDREKYEKIKLILLRKNLNQSFLAKEISISQQHLSLVIRGLSESQAVRQAIESILGEKIWNTNLENEKNAPLSYIYNNNINNIDNKEREDASTNSKNATHDFSRGNTTQTTTTKTKKTYTKSTYTPTKEAKEILDYFINKHIKAFNDANLIFIPPTENGIGDYKLSSCYKKAESLLKQFYLQTIKEIIDFRTNELFNCNNSWYRENYLTFSSFVKGFPRLLNIFQGWSKNSENPKAKIETTKTKAKNDIIPSEEDIEWVRQNNERLMAEAREIEANKLKAL